MCIFIIDNANSRKPEITEITIKVHGNEAEIQDQDEREKIRKQIYDKAMQRKKGEFFFVARESSASIRDGIPAIFVRPASCIYASKSEYKDNLTSHIKFTKKFARDVNLNLQGYLSRKDLLTLEKYGLHVSYGRYSNEPTLREVLSGSQDGKT